MLGAAELEPIARAAERAAGRSTVLVAVSEAPQRAHDVTAAAARVALAGIDPFAHDPVDLALWGRGGYVDFADALARALGPRSIARAWLLGPVDAAFALAALSAAELVALPGAGLGAPDAGLLGPGVAGEPAWVLEYASQGWSRLEGAARQSALRHAAWRAARAAQRAHLVRAVDDPQPWCERALGRGATLGPEACARLGREARWSTRIEAEMWEPVRAALAALLGHGEPPRPDFTEAELGEEVVFEPARKVAGAIATANEALSFCELDTGARDPDTGLYTGRWHLTGRASHRGEEVSGSAER